MHGAGPWTGGADDRLADAVHLAPGGLDRTDPMRSTRLAAGRLVFLRCSGGFAGFDEGA